MDNTSAMLWQLMQSMNTQTQDNQAPHEPQFEHTLMSLRPLLAPKQQKVLDLMIKLQELRALVDEINQ